MLKSKRTPILPPPVKKKYIIHIDPETCDGCMVCIKFCTPFSLEIGGEEYVNSRMIHHVVAAHAETCDGCGQCERICPTTSIFITEEDNNSEEG